MPGEPTLLDDLDAAALSAELSAGLARKCGNIDGEKHLLAFADRLDAAAARLREEMERAQAQRGCILSA